MQPFTTMLKLILLFFFLPFIQSANRTRKAGNGSYFYEPVDAIDTAFDEFPKLSDVFPTLVQKTPSDYNEMPGVTVKNISIDIEKIDINKFRKKMDAIAGMIAKDEPINYNASRRQQFVPTTVQPDYLLGIGQVIRRRCVDLMLQVVYMSRHQIMKIKEDEHFSTTDTGYRIAFLYEKLVRMHQKMIRFYSFAFHKIWMKPEQLLIMHGKVTRLHVDFCYLWWVLINLDGHYKRSTNVRQQTLELKELMQQREKLLAERPSNMGKLPYFM